MTWLIKISKIPNNLHASTNYSWDLLTDASWTTSQNLDTERSISAIPNASRLALCRTINSISSSISCNSTSNSRSNLHLVLRSARQLNAFLIQRWIQPRTSLEDALPTELKRISGALQMIGADIRADARRSNASCCKAFYID
jgi:hypothetical protein